jgi:hypothetical protein
VLCVREMKSALEVDFYHVRCLNIAVVNREVLRNDEKYFPPHVFFSCEGFEKDWEVEHTKTRRRKLF